MSDPAPEPSPSEERPTAAQRLAIALGTASTEAPAGDPEDEPGRD